MFNIDEMKRMDYPKYSKYLDKNPNHYEIGKYHDFDLAVQKSIEIAEVPAKLGLASGTTTEVIELVTKQYGLFENEMVTDGYVVVAHDEG